ncbi:Protein NRT1/ PTR FAMILY 5.6 [Quillaja saponaria]|uniref:Protein NRT1/ PTR FAMILY 5.6 n=1 Tax=Quillaja saponaria TaxID=32244 RepID=A0AAD7PR92_QUISA|nr:Protein NRT1/ PTR FAMILY 5.6 [Quillaja saponaria]
MENDKRKQGVRGEESKEEKWVDGGSVDYKGQVPLHSSTGVWKASLFIITLEFSERLSFNGIGSNLILYLTQVIHLDLRTAAKNVNYWSGTTTMMPLIGAFIADAYTGRFLTVMFSSLIYLLGLSLLTMSQLIPSLKPCNVGTCHRPRKLHEVVFFLALYCISVGTGGIKPCLESFGADQFDDTHMEERKKKMSFFNLWMFTLSCGILLGTTVIVYVEDYVSWGIASLILAIAMTVTIITFYIGKPFYRYRIPEGSPITPMLQVIIAATRKRHLACPSDHTLLHEVPKSEKSQGRLLSHTSRLRFLDKAAIMEEESMELKDNPWRLSTVTKVEETKLFLNVFPIWFCSLTFGVFATQATTFFIKQAASMNLKIIKNFKIPPASISTVDAIAIIISLAIYDRVLVPILRKATTNERGISILQRIGIGMLLSVIAMSNAALVEKKRLGLAGIGTLSVLWLVPQFIILGIGEAFTLVGLQEYFYDQVPDSMRSLGIALYLGVLGIGSFLGSLLITIVDHVTDKNGRSWIGKDLNSSCLDKFYWLLAALNALNFFIYVFIARRYTYKTVQRRVIEIDGYKGDGVELTA